MTAPLPVHLADLSHYNPDPDFRIARDRGLRGVYHKVTEGDSYVDPKYDERRAAAAKAGLPFGGYHFARAEYLNGKPDARTEARRFLAEAAPRPGDLVPMLDLETAEGLTPGELKRWARIFSATVEEVIGVKPILYTQWDFGLPNIRWVPRYNNTNTPPEIPWDIWQFSDGDSGVPNQLEGLGHVDLNVFGPGTTLKTIRLPLARPEPRPEPNFTVLTFQHTSMQYSDDADQMRADANRLFKRGKHVLTGTEAGEQPLKGILREVAREYGYRFYANRGQWVAVRADLITGNWETGYEPVLESDEGTGRHTDRGVTWVGFDTKDLGRVYVGAGHYLNDGQAKGQQNYDLNLRYGRGLSAWAREKGAGSALVFYGGDQNMNDRIEDTFLGAPLTSAADELQHWEGTHGKHAIDVIASYDKDGRVEAVFFQVLDDREYHLNTDHYLLEAGFKVEHLAAA